MVYSNLTSNNHNTIHKGPGFFQFSEIPHEILYLSLYCPRWHENRNIFEGPFGIIIWNNGFVWAYSYIEWIMIPPIVSLYRPGKHLAGLYSLLLPSECWNTKTESVRAHTQRDYSLTRISNRTVHHMDYAATSYSLVLICHTTTIRTEAPLITAARGRMPSVWCLEHVTWSGRNVRALSEL